MADLDLGEEEETIDPAFELFWLECAELFGWSLDPLPPIPARNFDIFNDRHFSNHDGKSTLPTFSRFGDLPSELRLKIWAINLRQHRFLDVVLTPPPGTGDNDPAGQHIYQAFFRSRSLSPLFSVCHESANEANAFYSIRLACFTTPNHAGIMRLSPEWDMLNIYTHNGSDHHHWPTLREPARAICEFLHDLKTADWHDRGAVHVCLDLKGMKALRDLDVTELAPHLRQSYQASVAGLRRIYFRCTPHADFIRMGCNLVFTRTLTWYSTTMPLIPRHNLAPDAVEVDFLGVDTRPIAPDLHDVWVGHDPRQISSLWTQIQRNAGLPQSNTQCQCRVLLAAEPDTDWRRRPPGGHPPASIPMDNRASVDAYLSQEVANFCRNVDDNTKPLFGPPIQPGEWRQALKARVPPGVPPLPSAEEFVDVRVPETAVGFWLFDPADLERLAPVNPAGQFAGKGVWKNLSEFGVKPELCVFNLGRR